MTTSYVVDELLEVTEMVCVDFKRKKNFRKDINKKHSKKTKDGVIRLLKILCLRSSVVSRKIGVQSVHRRMIRKLLTNNFLNDFLLSHLDDHDVFCNRVLVFRVKILQKVMMITYHVKR